MMATMYGGAAKLVASVSHLVYFQYILQMLHTCFSDAVVREIQCCERL